jgi:hypothetical protein
VKRDECGLGGDPSGCRGEARVSRAYERNRRTCVRESQCECGLPEQERRNCRSEFKRYPGRGRFHVRAGRNESHTVVGSTAYDRIRTVSARNDGGHGEGGAEAVAQTKEGKEETFRRALAWRKLVFRLVELVNQSKEKDCESLSKSPMICIGD